MRFCVCREMYVTCLPNVTVMSSLAEDIIGEIDATENFLLDWEIRIVFFSLMCYVAHLGKILNPL
jgi:hypothetical protein